MTVAYFATCLADQFFAEAAADGVRLLRSLDVEVFFPPGQTCCGQPAWNAGYRSEAERMARHTLEVFAGAEHVVLPSGSCAAMMRNHSAEVLGEDPASRETARELAGKTWELSQFIVRVLGIESLGPPDALEGRRIAYHHGCHALRGLDLETEPLTLLCSAGAELVDWEAAKECCGFGGLFAVKLPEVSTAMADRKLETLPGYPHALSPGTRGSGETAPLELVSADGGCLMHMAGRMEARGARVPVRHLASVLWEARRG
ncbi:MAG: (Fe-S)-binding protein [bacterium]